MRWRDASRSRDEASERIEAAFVEVVCERGYSATTVGAVCQRAGVDAEVFERRFSDLEDCLCSYFDNGASELLTASARVFFATEGSWRDCLRRVAFNLLRFLQEDPDRARVMMVEVLAAGDRARLVRDQGMQALTFFIDQGRTELDDPESMSVTTAEAICGAIFNQILFEVEKENFESLPGLLPKLMYSAVLPYLGPEVAREELGRAVPAPK